MDRMDTPSPPCQSGQVQRLAHRRKTRASSHMLESHSQVSHRQRALPGRAALITSTLPLCNLTN
jgi:hypothetical protein